MKGSVRFGRAAFAIAAVAFALCVAVQVLLAGMAVFVDALYWARHTSFVHFIEFVPLLMLAFAFTGKLPAGMRWLSGGLFGLVLVMYFTANFGSVSPVVAAFHPVVALGLFGLSARVAIRGCKLWKERGA